MTNTKAVHYQEPAISKFLFASPYLAPLWLVLRIWLGWQWLSSGWGKVQNPAWVGENAGVAVTGYLQGALARAGGEAPSVSGWYAWMVETMFLPNATLMSYAVAFGEVLVGITLILGLLTGLSAFFGGFMNVSFLLAGTLSSNPVMFMVATWIVLGWRIAGYWGLDYWILPIVGAPRKTVDNDTEPPVPRRSQASLS